MMTQRMTSVTLHIKSISFPLFPFVGSGELSFLGGVQWQVGSVGVVFVCKDGRLAFFPPELFSLVFEGVTFEPFGSRPISVDSSFCSADISLTVLVSLVFMQFLN